MNGQGLADTYFVLQSEEYLLHLLKGIVTNLMNNRKEETEIMNSPDRKLILEDGSEYIGYHFGSQDERVCEIVFNTSMVGYQEILSDPSYTDQMVVMTYPLIGNYGITDEDFESRLLSIGGMIVRDYNDMPSNFRYTQTYPRSWKRTIFREFME